MKQFITAVALSLLALTAQAQQTITIFYGWNAADKAANFHRTLAMEANKQQSKYNFIFDVKPGAGAAIAAMHVEKTPNTILATSSAFWIRPNFFPKESHNVENFRELMPSCDAPLVMVSKKYKSFNEVPTDKPLTVAVSGLGITTHLVATEVAKKYPNMTIVPFKSTTDSVLSVLSGTTDFGVNFVGDSDQYTAPDAKNRLYVLGVSGDRPFGTVQPFSKQGFDKNLFNMNAPAHMVVPTSWSEAQFKEIRAILVKAGQADSVHEAYKADYCHSLNQMSDADIQPWFNASNARWKKIAAGISLK
ncbi:Bordetella uptake gene [uncultured Caudovirales phage]|uniref:Bordetella uptake protein n=1 Tax=uncultured Caudovirales phage TaxID=2100421 RepID=A0A6J7WH31_9CAUD|nr:Bordetella uptake gene [uncultured Caudovirales phage]